MGSNSPSYFSSLPKVEKDEVFGLMAAYHADSHQDRVNLGAGVYSSDEGRPWPLRVVERLEKSMPQQDDINRHDYLPIEGDPRFLTAARNLVFSTYPSSAQEPPQLHQQQQDYDESRIVSVQAISGTGANHIGARFLAENLRPGRVWLPEPTWANHHAIWESVGVERGLYPHYSAARSCLNFDAMMAVLKRDARPQDVIVLHACAHNPTGCDPSREQWKAIADLCQRRQIFPFFDNAYQGFASGSPTDDAWAINYFRQLQHPPMEMCVAQSFSKNFGLYGQRVGAFHLVTNDTSDGVRENVLNCLSHMIRSEYSVAPRYGSTIVRNILESKGLTQAWQADLDVISARIKAMRHALYDELIRLGTPGSSWRHVIDQV